MISGAKRDRSTAETGARLSGNISYFSSHRAVSFLDFPGPCNHIPWRFFSPIHRIIGLQWHNGPDRQRKLGRDCLQISVMSARSMPLDFEIFLISVIIYQGGLFHPIHRIIGRRRKRALSTAETGTPQSGNISYVASPHFVSFRVLPGQCRHLPGRCFFA